jgi:tyrosyl-tRNA synthetase
MFGAKSVPEKILPSSTVPRGRAESDDGSVPTSFVDADMLKEGIPAFKLYHITGLANSGGEARRLIQQGGAYINDKRLNEYDYLISVTDMCDGEIVLRAGKKRYHKIKMN